jgi:hypothetical protein
MPVKTRSQRKNARRSATNSAVKSQKRNNNVVNTKMNQMVRMVNNVANAPVKTSKKSAKSVLKLYRAALMKSECRKKGPAVCRSKANCKVASGKKRSFCRKSKNGKY